MEQSVEVESLERMFCKNGSVRPRVVMEEDLRLWTIPPLVVGVSFHPSKDLSEPLCLYRPLH